MRRPSTTVRPAIHPVQHLPAVLAALLPAVGAATAAPPPPPTLPGLAPAVGAPAQRPPAARDVVKVDHAGLWRDADGRIVVGLRFTMAPKWHIYWINSGDSGMATTVDSTLPEGWSAGATIFPRPDVIREEDAVTFGYDERAVLLVPLKPGADAGAGRATFHAKFLVCHNVCIAGDGRVTVALPEPAAVAELPLLPQTIEGRSLPQPLAAVGGRASIERGGRRLVVRGPWPPQPDAPTGDHVEIRFLPFALPGFTLPESDLGTGHAAGGAFELSVPVALDPNDAPGQPLAAGGLVTFGRERTDPCYDFLVEVSAPTDRE